MSLPAFIYSMYCLESSFHESPETEKLFSLDRRWCVSTLLCFKLSFFNHFFYLIMFQLNYACLASFYNLYLNDLWSHFTWKPYYFPFSNWNWRYSSIIVYAPVYLSHFAISWGQFQDVPIPYNMTHIAKG